MSMHRYRPEALRGDLIRAAVGVALSAGGAMLAASSLWALAIFAAAGVLFVAFGLRTLARLRIRYELTDAGIARHSKAPLVGDARIPWSRLEAMSLRFYSTRRDRSTGWMQLTVKGSGGRISLDSTIDDFDAVARAAAMAAGDKGLDLRTSTLANLEALGINTARLGTDGRHGEGPR